MIIFTIWFIGWLFSIGLCMGEGENKGLEGLKANVSFLFLWPLLLGCFLRDAINTGKI